MSNTKNNAASQETRRKLIAAAGEVFAELGLHKATVREITDRAGVNIAAINYHFRDKVELYLEVVRQSHARMVDEMRLENVKGTPEARLTRFIESLVNHFMDPEQPDWHVKIFWREMNEPSTALNQMVEEIAKPISDHLHLIVSDLISQPPKSLTTILAANSIVGQCMFYFHQRAVLDRLFPDLPELRDRQILARHIAHFSLSSLKNWRKPS